MLLDEIKKMKEELAQAEEKEVQEVETEKEEEVEAEETKEDIEKDEKTEQEPEIKEEKSEEKELDNAGYARLRREAAAEKRRAQQLETELNELRKAKEVEETTEEAPLPLPPEMQSIIEDHRLDRAEREFSIFENKVKEQHPEYNAVSSEYAAAWYHAIKLQNPRKSDIELGEMTKKAIIMRAAEYARAGYENPVEEMYHEARELGFTGKSLQREERAESKEEKVQPDLRKVAENRKRSTGMTANNGRSEGVMTVGAAANLSASEWAKLPAAEKRRLMYGQ